LAVGQCLQRLPLSPSLSRLLRRGEREKTVPRNCSIGFVVSPATAQYLLHRPESVLGDQRFRVVGGALHIRQGVGVADVAQGDADVAQQSASLRPDNRRGGTFPFKAGVVEGEELDQIRLSQ